MADEPSPDELAPDDPHRRPDGASDALVEAVGKVSEAMEWVERARGHLYELHQLMGHADLLFGEAADALADAGADEVAGDLREQLVGRKVLEGRWTFQIVEEFDDGYWAEARAMEGRVRDELLGGRRHVFESEMKEERRTHGRRDHEARPGSGAVSGAARPLPLADLRVIDCATVVAGPGCARYLADFGADVIKVERPDGGDTTRAMGWRDPADDVTLWWKLAGRNKRSVVLDLKDPVDLDRMRRLVATADVLVENFRPGTLERLGLAPADLIAANPELVVTRVTGFGQDGPYAGRPGFATLAEAMSGFASINGEPDGAPLLPPIALTDEVTAIVAAFATLVAVHSGVGQVVDVNLLESLFQLMGPLISAHHLLGYEQPRLGSGIPYSVPRGTYRCADGHWVAISTSAESVAQRVMALVGAGEDPRFASFDGRIANRDEVDRLVADFVGARPLAEVLREFDEAHAAAAPVHSMADIAADPHYAARRSVVDLDGVPMQGLIARLSATPGRLRWAGRPLGADTDEVLAELDPD